MDPTLLATVAGIIKTIVDLTPTIIKTVEDAEPFAEKLIAAISGKEPSEADLATLEAEVDALIDKLINTEIPPEED